MAVALGADSAFRNSHDNWQYESAGLIVTMNDGRLRGHGDDAVIGRTDTGRDRSVEHLVDHAGSGGERGRTWR